MKVRVEGVKPIRDRKLSQTILHIFQDTPFFAVTAAKAEYYTAKRISVLGEKEEDRKEHPGFPALVDFNDPTKTKIYINRGVWKKGTPSALSEFIEHELLHSLLGHGEPTDLVGELGQDFSINKNLISIENIDKEFPSLQGWAYDKVGLPPELTWTQYREELIRKGMKPRQTTTYVIVLSQGQGKGEKEIKGSRGAPREKLSPLAKQALLQDIKEAAESYGAGNQPALLEKILGILNRPRESWQEKVKRLIGNTLPVEHRYTWAKRNRKFPWVQPGHRRIRRACGIVAADCSGSVSDEQYKHMIKQIDYLLTDSNLDLWLFYFETEISAKHHISDLSRQEQRRVLQKRVGYGGTDFRPIFKAVEEIKIKPDFVLVYTDGYGPWPSNPPVKCPVFVVDFRGKEEHYPSWTTVINASQ